MRIGSHLFHHYIYSHLKSFLLGIFMLMTGVCIGALYCTRLPQTANDALYGAFGGENGLFTVTDSFLVFRAAFVNELRLWVLLSLCATSRLGLAFAPFILGVRGFVCGFSVAALCVLYGRMGFGAAAVGILPQMLLVFPAIQLLCCAAMCRAGAQPLPEQSARRGQFLLYCVFSLTVLCVLAMAAFYEGYIGWRLILKILS